MFSKLIASGPQKRRTWTPGAVSVSVIVHGLLLAGAVYASVQPPAAEDPVEEEVTFLEIEEPEAPEPPQAPEPPPTAPVVPPPPQGFQELIPPVDPPSVIPLVDDAQPAVNLADFSGVGVAGGTADGVAGGTPQNTARDSSFAYEVAVLDSPPRLSNARQIQGVMTRLYPRLLQDAGIGGTVTMQFVIEPDGTVDESSVRVVSSTHEQFSEATIQAVERFEFVPGRFQGQPVRVLIQMPVSWQARS